MKQRPWSGCRQLARCLLALLAFTTAAAGTALRFPGQRNFHVNGTPREQLRPALEVDPAKPQGGPGDPILYQALRLLEKR